MTEEIRSRLAIERLLARYCQLRDAWRFDEMVDELFHVDALMVGKDSIAEGREGIRQMLTGGRNRTDPKLNYFGSPCKHIVCNTVLDIEGDFGRSVSDVANVQFHEGRFIITNVARYEDWFARRGERWWYILKRPHASWRENSTTNWA